MKFEAALIVVRDMEQSRSFYENLLDQEAIMDLGANVAYDGFSLQTLEYWVDFIDKVENDIDFLKNNNSELYFEIDDYDTFIEKFNNYNDFEVEIVHKTKEFPWGQRVIRFYDPDNHMIEVGESMDSVVKKFFNNGMSIEEIVEKTGFPVEFVVDLKNKLIN
ncbi:glyoxalase/bleomycin resistance/dioxygenase family protein [Methanobrevibacter sp. TMH8]|uniref:VOC family protein n=1 Tax=Methanobrevibacter sp. TMH8 TaxID=2848611 RepID=UPI001CCA02E6|nr:VOC family protein [Methanobrevibacter sp. TMH8]MBZ9570801.1 glyoxalase/bleomycin resistance/dioxygenase family protein [Methanobrevibacter sp. TMH8]